MSLAPEDHGAIRRDYDRELAGFAEHCREFASGEALPAALAHSESGARQWVSDELTRRAAQLAVLSRKENTAWLALVGRRAVWGVWGLFALILVVDFATAPFSQNWTLPRTATPLAFLAFAALFTMLSAVHGDIGGILCFLVGVDGRMSLPRTLGLLWSSATFTALVYFGVEELGASSASERASIQAAVTHPRWEYLVLLAAPVVVSVVTSAVSAARMRRRVTPYLPGQRSQLRDLLAEETGLGSLAAAVWLPVNLVAVVLLVIGIAGHPYGLPPLPSTVVWLAVAGAVLFTAVKFAEVRRPVLVSVVRVRAPGGQDGPVRQGDDIEIRGLGFVPAGASSPDQLARVVVKLGPVHLSVPLVPDIEGGFRNPADTTVTVTVPYDVEPGPWSVRVVTAAGLETSDYPIDIYPADE